MSKIIAKAFNASKKIIHSIFLGSPNLFTTSDLNRQIEAIKFQLDTLDDKVGLSSDFNVESELLYDHEDEVAVSATYDYSYMFFKGCAFNPQKKTLQCSLTNDSPTFYICLIAEVETVTYDTDFTHDIAGAKFEDGTSRPAANQVVYKNEDIVCTSDPSSLDTFVGILATISLTSTPPYHVVRTNCLKDYESLRLNSEGAFLLNTQLKQPVTSGMSYSDAISAIYNKLSVLCPTWTRFVNNDIEYDTNFGSLGEGRFFINNGHLFVDTSNCSLGVIPQYNDESVKYAVVGKFPSSVETSLIQLFESSLNYQYIRKRTLHSGEAISVLGTLTTVLVSFWANPDMEMEDLKFQRIGFASLCLAATFSTTSQKLNGVKLIVKLDSLTHISNDYLGVGPFVPFNKASMCYLGEFPDIVSVPLPIQT